MGRTDSQGQLHAKGVVILGTLWGLEVGSVGNLGKSGIGDSVTGNRLRSYRCESAIYVTCM